jgi:hypothetical protein
MTLMITNPAEQPNITSKRGVPVWVFIVSLLFAVIITAAVAGGGVYLWQQLNLQKQKNTVEQLQQQLQQAQKIVPLNNTTTVQPTTQPETPSPTPISATVKSDFIKAVNEKDLTAITPLLSDRIDYTKFETSCCGLITTNDALQYLQFINSPATYDFSPVQDAVTNIKTVLPKFQDFVIGIGSDKTVIGFRISDHSNKVDAILQATNYEAFEIKTPTSPSP